MQLEEMFGKKARNPARAVRTVVERRYISLKPGVFHMPRLPGGLLQALHESSNRHILIRKREAEPRVQNGISARIWSIRVRSELR